MVEELMGLASQKYGMHKNVCIVQATTLEEAKYHLHNQHSVTEEYYQHCKVYPIYGIGQGSGSSPVLLIIISSILIGACQENSTPILVHTVCTYVDK